MTAGLPGSLLAVLLVLGAALPAHATAPKARSAPAQTPLEAIAEAFGEGDYERTLTLVGALGPAGESNAEALFYRGYALLRLERHEEALVVIERTLTLSPDDVRAIYLRGVLRVTLGRPGAAADFARVKREVPDAPIGISAGEYLQELATDEASEPRGGPAPTSAAGAPTAPAAGPAGTEPSPGGAASTAAPEEWRVSPDLRLTLDYDSNPALLPVSASPGLQSQAGSPAVAIYGRADATHLLSPETKLGLAVSALQLLYRHSQQTDPLHEGNPGGGSYRGSSNLTDLAAVAWLELRQGSVLTRGEARAELLLYGFSLFAHEYTLGARVTWPASSVLSGTLRLSGWALLPLDSNYDFLRGFGGSARPLLSLLLLDGALLVEGGWAFEVYRARDYFLKASPGEGRTDTFRSYSYWAQGPELYVSLVTHGGVRASGWATVSSRRYLDASTEGPFLSIVRQDSRVSLGAHAGLELSRGRELFLEASWTRNDSNFDPSGFLDQNYRRFLVSVGFEYR